VPAELSPLQRRLDWVDEHPETEWIIALENVPQWETFPVLPAETSGAEAWTYASSHGHSELVTEVRKREGGLGRHFSAENVLITHGALFGLGLVFRHLRAQGAAAMVCQAPVLGSVRDLVVASGLAVVLADEADLVAAVRESARNANVAVYVNSPHNPLGSVIDQGVVHDLLERQGVPVVVDAVYDAYDFSGRPQLFPAGRPGLFLVNSVSKNYGAPGLRVGWVLGDAEAVRDLTVRLEYETIAVPGAGQLWAAELIRHGNDQLVDRVRQGRALVADWWARLGRTERICGPGGTQAWVPVPETDGSFADDVLHKSGLVVVDSGSYAGVRGSYVRVPFGCPADHLRVVLHAMEQAIT
jgi:aspartate aminotransferase